MAVLQRRRVGDGPGRYVVSGKQVADVRSPKAVPDAGVLGVGLAVPLLDGSRPPGHGVVSKGNVLVDPAMEVKAGVDPIPEVVALALAILRRRLVFPDWVLRFAAISESSSAKNSDASSENIPVSRALTPSK